VAATYDIDLTWIVFTRKGIEIRAVVFGEPAKTRGMNFVIFILYIKGFF
jgi:hypothetical protein